MKILISSHAFAPSIGGIETVTYLLAAEFHRLGEEVIVVTQTPSDGNDNLSWRVARQPSLGELVRLVRWCDIFWQNNLSLRMLWPAWLLHKPVVITHQGSYCRRPAGLDLVQRLKHAIVQGTPSVAPSRAVAECFSTSSTIIPNPFDAQTFRSLTIGTERERDLVFLGRLVTEKGIDLLLESLARLKERDLNPNLTIIGTGPEEENLKELTRKLGLSEEVTFAGAKRGDELVALLGQHKILVVPSRYDEPFGVVALEGIASGCAVVGSSGGGLPEAIGPCGVTFPNGDAEALTQTLADLLSHPNEQRRMTTQASEHLARFTAQTVAQSYLDLFRAKIS